MTPFKIKTEQTNMVSVGVRFKKSEGHLRDFVVKQAQMGGITQPAAIKQMIEYCLTSMEKKDGS